MQRTHLFVLAALFLHPLAALAQPPPTEAVPPRVVHYAEQVWTRLIDTLDVESLLRPSCKELAGRVRRSPNDSPIDNEFFSAELIVQLTDREFCNALVGSFTFRFQFMMAQFSSMPLGDRSLSDEDKGAKYVEVVEQFFPGHELRYSRKDLLVDAAGRPFFPDLRTREDVARWHQLMKGFRSLKAQGVNWKTPMLKANDEEFARNFPVDSRVTADGGSQYHQCRYGWCIIIDNTAKKPKVTAFVPFSQ